MVRTREAPPPLQIGAEGPAIEAVAILLVSVRTFRWQRAA
jgi:hypothetical protein